MADWFTVEAIDGDITATHDVNNPRSGRVMKRLGMNYQYSYEEQWQPSMRRRVCHYEKCLF